MKKIILIQLLIIGILASCNLIVEHQIDKGVEDIYKMRMEGKVDEAKAILDTAVEVFPDNAMAQYEMARVKQYMMIGGGDVKLEDVMESINQAVENAPGSVVYAYYQANTSFLDAYMSMQMGGDEVKNKVTAACEQFENVLKLKPDYHEARLTLVEIYGMLPPDMGGNPEKASEYSEKLAEMDTYFGAKAKSILASEDMDYVKYWEGLIAEDKENPKFLMEAGKACLYAEDPGKAEEFFNQARELDPAFNILLLDLSRYHMYMVMQNQELMETELPLAREYSEKYLETKPEPIVPLRAYALGMISRFEKFLGNEEASEKKMQEAKSLDPYFSRATGVPSMINFIPPDEICYCYSSYFGPF
jgi:tetratricopeptide (TPR) repeat protein